MPRNTGEAFAGEAFAGCTLPTDTFFHSKQWPSYHNGDFPLADVEVWHIIYTHPLQRAARAAGRAHQEHRGEATWRTQVQKEAAA